MIRWLLGKRKERQSDSDDDDEQETGVKPWKPVEVAKSKVDHDSDDEETAEKPSDENTCSHCGTVTRKRVGLEQRVSLVLHYQLLIIH